jgi:hypothetical protein
MSVASEIGFLKGSVRSIGRFIHLDMTCKQFTDKTFSHSCSMTVLGNENIVTIVFLNIIFKKYIKINFLKKIIFYINVLK